MLKVSDCPRRGHDAPVGIVNVIKADLTTHLYSPVCFFFCFCFCIFYFLLTFRLKIHLMVFPGFHMWVMCYKRLRAPDEKTNS